MSTASFQLSTSPTRPTLVDYGDNLKQNSTRFPPKPQDPNADETNKMALGLEAIGRLSFTTVLTYTRAGTVFTLVGVESWNNALVIADFNTAFSRVGVGNYTITIPANKIPTIKFKPLVTLNETASVTAGAYDVSVSGSIITLTVFRNNVRADCDFTIYIF
jgi:hypothetical protein